MSTLSYSTDMDDNWFYSKSVQEKEAKKEEVWSGFIFVEMSLFIIKVRKLFLAADKNGDGKLSKEEWIEVLQRSGASVEK